jgi:hypothetical protein
MNEKNSKSSSQNAAVKTSGQILQDARDGGASSPHAAVVKSGALNPGQTTQGIAQAMKAIADCPSCKGPR